LPDVPRSGFVCSQIHQKDAVAHWEHLERGKNLFLSENKNFQALDYFYYHYFSFLLLQERWFLLPDVPINFMVLLYAVGR